MNIDELTAKAEACKGVEADLKRRLGNACADRGVAYRELNAALALEKGIKVGDIVSAVEPYSWSEARYDCVVKGFSESSIGSMITQKVTEKDKIHQGRKVRVVNIETANLTDRVLVVD